MLPPKSLACFDAGSEYCPCILAALGKCIACSMLQGRDTCDCGWSGICVFAEFERAGKQVKPGREQILAQVTEVTPLARPRDDYKAYLAEIAMPPNLARWCTLPGSFVLLRPESAREAFNVPISVMDTAGRGIRIAVECRGPKTTALEKASAQRREGDRNRPVLVRAPGLHPPGGLGSRQYPGCSKRYGTGSSAAYCTVHLRPGRKPQSPGRPGYPGHGFHRRDLGGAGSFL